MVYVDEYESPVIVDSPPKTENTSTPPQQTAKEEQKVLDYFWSFLSETINKNFQTVQQVLSNYGINAQNPEQAVAAATNFWGTEKWVPFVKDISPLLEEQKQETMKVIAQQTSNVMTPKKNNQILIIVLVLIALGVAAYFLFKNKKA